MQAVADELPAGEPECSGHATHAVEASAAAYLPSSQFAHDLACVHVQSAEFIEYFPAGQSRQTVAVETEKVPLAH